MAPTITTVALVLAACSKAAPQRTSPPSGSGRSQQIAVSLQQWSVTPASTSVGSGRITFNVENKGSIPHEFVVLSTDTVAADFPITSFEGEPDRFDEDTAGTNVGETGDMNPNATKSITIDLAPGHYALVCNLPSHYRLGMHIDFTVT
jgi:uncharacterized cupredoxin-like copper-binding protein